MNEQNTREAISWKDCPDCQHTVFSDEEHICRTPAEPKCECGATKGEHPNPVSKVLPNGAGEFYVCDGYHPFTPEPASEGKLRYDLELLRHPDGSLEWVEDDPPTAPPASIEDRAKAFLMSRNGSFPNDRFVAYQELASFAQTEISRQRPEIERAAVERYKAELINNVRRIERERRGPHAAAFILEYLETGRD